MNVKPHLRVSSALLLAVGGCATAGRPAKLVEITPTKFVAQPDARPDDALYQAAVSAIERRDYALALDALQAARSRSPDDARVWNAMGVVYDKLGRFDLSARYYAQAEELDPGSRVVAENKAYSAVLQQKQVEPRGLAGDTAPDLTQAAVPTREIVAAAEPSIVGAPAAVRRAEMGSVTLTATPPTDTPEPVVARPIVAAAPNPLLVFRGPTLRRTEIRPVALTATPPVLAAAPSQQPAVRPASSQAVVATRPPPATPARIASASPRDRITLVRSSARVGSLLGRPLLLVNASGRKGGAEPVRLRLASRGWSAPAAAVRPGNVRAVSTIRYASRNVVVARALARTLPYRVRLESCGATCRGVTLYIGADALRWSRTRLAPSAYRVRA